MRIWLLLNPLSSAALPTRCNTVKSQLYSVGSRMNVVKCIGVGAIAVLSLLTLLTPAVDACSCMPKHPQAHFCDSDYVIVMRVLRKSHRLVKNRIAYKIEVKKSYKMTDEAQHILKHGRILTPVHDTACGVNFEVGKLYVVAGKGNTLYLCNYIKEYQNMTIIERRGFAGSYRKGCDCNIKFCMGSCGNMNNQSCRWSPFSKCETDYSSCVPTIYRTPEGLHRKCDWKRTPPYKTCMADP